MAAHVHAADPMRSDETKRRSDGRRVQGQFQKDLLKLFVITTCILMIYFNHLFQLFYTS